MEIQQQGRLCILDRVVDLILEHKQHVIYRVKSLRTLTISDLNILVKQIGGQETQRNLSLMRQAPQFNSVANLKIP
jgi:hypothetical protein